jgi:hypothetical protein
MSDVVYPYRVPYTRTQNWYSSDWGELSNWCNECIGPGNWEFYYSEFVFTELKYKNWFQLRWGDGQ